MGAPGPLKHTLLDLQDHQNHTYKEPPQGGAAYLGGSDGPGGDSGVPGGGSGGPGGDSGGPEGLIRCALGALGAPSVGSFRGP